MTEKELKAAKRVLSRYRTREATCIEIEDRIIRCKSRKAESKLMDLVENVWSIATSHGLY